MINNNELIVTEKSGKIKIVNIKTNEVSEIKHNLNFLDHGQGGLLDILFKESFVYISYSENRGNWKSSTSIAKAKFDKMPNQNLHIASVHEGKKPFKCEICDDQFELKHELNEQIASLHEEENQSAQMIV